MHNLKENALEAYGRILAFANAAIMQKRPWWKQPLVFFVIATGIVAFLGMAHPVDAVELTGYLNRIIAWLLEMIAGFLGKLILAVIDLLIVVSGYNNFIDADVVNTGWVLVRDVANMFYIFVMLVIAFGTMLKLEAYTWTKLLPRLIITAVVVNFSRTIMGVIIDFAQVIMITFVNGYAAAAGGNFAQGFSLDAMFKIKEGITGTNPDFQIVLAYLLATTMLAIALVVVSVFLAILIGRIITIWILVILSPLAFLMGTFPKGQEYYGKWWKQFQNAVIVGPILAFFLWLSLATMSGGNSWNTISSGSALGGRELETKDLQIGAGEAGSIEKVGSFVVSIAMLMIGLQMTQELGVMGSGLASGAASAIKSTATKVARAVAVPAAGVVATGGVGALGAWTLPMMAGTIGLGKKGISKSMGSWKEGKGILGMGKNIYTRAGAYVEKKGYEGTGIGKLYGWKYHMGELSDVKAEKAKEEAEFAKQKAAGRAREEVEEARGQPRVAHEQRAVLAKMNQYQKDYGDMEVTELMAALRQSMTEVKKKPGNADVNARMLALLKLAASDGRIDDANMDLDIVRNLFGEDAIKTEEVMDTAGKVTGTKQTVQVTGESQRKMLMRQMFNLGPGDKITDEMMDNPVFQGNLSALEDIGRTGSKIGHYQFSKMRVWDDKNRRYTIRGLERQGDGTWEYTANTDAEIRSAQETDMGKKAYLGDASPQTFWDHEAEYVTDQETGKTTVRMKRKTVAKGGKDVFDKSGLTGMPYADVGRKLIQQRTLVDLLQGYLADEFLDIDPADGSIQAAGDFSEKALTNPGAMGVALLKAKGQGVKKIKFRDVKGNDQTVDITEIKRETVEAAIEQMTGSKIKKSSSTKAPIEQVNEIAGGEADNKEMNAHINAHSTDDAGATHPDLQNDLRSVLSIDPAIDLNHLNNLSDDLGKEVVKLVEAAGKFGATMEKAADNLGKTIQKDVNVKDPAVRAQLQQRLDLILTELKKKLRVKKPERDQLTSELSALIKDVEDAKNK